MTTSLSTKEFHFVMGRDMKKRLNNMPIYKQIGSLSGVIVRILSLLGPVLDKEHKWGKQRMSRYMPVTGSPDEKREHVHVYLPGAMYRHLKLMHQDLNFYSIAQLVRGFLEFFLGMFKVYGDGVFQELERVYKEWNQEDVKNRLTPRKFIRQLNILLRHLPGQHRLINIYSSHYSPFWVFRL